MFAVVEGFKVDVLEGEDCTHDCTVTFVEKTELEQLRSSGQKVGVATVPDRDAVGDEEAAATATE